MKKTKQKCSYPIFEALAQEQDSQAAILHASQCLECAEKLVRLQVAILNSRQNDQGDIVVSETELAVLAEKFVSQGEIALVQSSQYGRIRHHAATFARFQQLVSYLKALQAPLELQVPETLKNFVRGQTESAEAVTGQKAAGKVFLRIQNGLKLISDAVADVFVLPELGEAVPVRSVAGLDVPQTASMVQFFTPAVPNGKPSDAKILYQAVQDGVNSVMLTVRLQDYQNLPRIINVKRDGRVIHSYPVREEYAYFPQLEPGSYVIELKDQMGSVVRQLQIEIVLGDY